MPGYTFTSVASDIYVNYETTLSNGYLGSRNDEERSEMRYVMRIAEFSESSNLWTQIALSLAWEYASLSIGSIYLDGVPVLLQPNAQLEIEFVSSAVLFFKQRIGRVTSRIASRHFNNARSHSVGHWISKSFCSFQTLHVRFRTAIHLARGLSRLFFEPKSRWEKPTRSLNRTCSWN